MLTGQATTHAGGVMRKHPGLLMLLVFTVFTGFAAPSADAQFGKLKDKLKDKVEKKADKKTDETIDKALEGPAKTGEEAAAPADTGQAPEGDAPAPATAAAATAPGGTKTAEDMTLYTKYDFIPGDKVLFFDDLAGEETGEFPSRWGLENGVFEIAKVGTQNWILCTNRGTVYPKMTPGALPDKYTVEMEFFSNAGDHDGWYTLQWVDGENQAIGHVQIGYSYLTNLEILGKKLADKQIAKLAKGKHVLRIMATKSTVKCYIDQERIANVPKVEGFAPVKFAVELNPYFDENKAALIGAFRYAEGGKTLKEQLAEAGRIVTHGILFDSGSDRIKAESYKTLADIGALLTESPALRVSIEGHTDSDGADEANMTLSNSRAQSVRAYLVDHYKIEGGRLEAKGWGEGQPMAKNDTAEGKAMNRRVELVKLQ